MPDQAPNLTPEQWKRVADTWATHGQGYGTGDQDITVQLYRAAGIDPNQVAGMFAQGLIKGQKVE